MWSLPALVKKKRKRASHVSQPLSAISGAAEAASLSAPQVPRMSSSAASWGVADLSDSEGELEGTESYGYASGKVAGSSSGPSSPSHSREAYFTQPRPSKRMHLDEATSGRFASLKLDPNGHRLGRQHSPSSLNDRGKMGGVGRAFGQSFLPSPVSSDLGLSNGLVAPTRPTAPPSSPTKTVKEAAGDDEAARQAYLRASAPPISPVMGQAVYAVPPASPIRAEKQNDWGATRVETLDGDIAEVDMRIRKGPTSYEIEPNRIIVNSLDDTSSSDNDGASDADDNQTPDSGRIDGSEQTGKGTEFVVNTELMEKLEAHRRAIFTGTSNRDNVQSSGNGKGPGSKARRGGRRSGGGGLTNLGSKRRSGNSSPASSSGYVSPINAEEARGALVLWRDPEEVLKASAKSTDSPTGSFGWSIPANASPAMTPSNLSSNPTFGGFSFGDTSSSPLATQQSSLSSSYFPSSNMEAQFGQHEQQQQSRPAWDQAPPAWNGIDTHTQLHSYEAQPIDMSGHFGMADDMELDD